MEKYIKPAIKFYEVDTENLMDLPASNQEGYGGTMSNESNIFEEEELPKASNIWEED